MASDHATGVFKHARLTNRRTFVQVQKYGQRFKGLHLILLVVLDHSWAQVGFTVSRRVGHAVVRNRVRRRLKEIIRLQALQPGRIYVVIALPSAASASFDRLHTELECLLNRAHSWACQPQHG